MAKMASCAPLLLLTIFFSVNQALAFPLPVKHTLQVGNFGGPRVTLPELAFYSVSIVGKRSRSIILLLCSHPFLSLVPLRAAIFVLFVGVYIQSVMTEARASAIFRSFHRTSSHPSIRRFPRLTGIHPISSRQCYHSLTSPSCLFSLRCTRCRWPSRACATSRAQGGTCLPNVGISCPLVSASEPTRASRLRLSQRRKLRI